MRKNIYALYKGEKFITVKGCKVNTISFLATNAYKKRMKARKYKNSKPNHLILIKIDEE